MKKKYMLTELRVRVILCLIVVIKVISIQSFRQNIITVTEKKFYHAIRMLRYLNCLFCGNFCEMFFGNEKKVTKIMFSLIFTAGV